MPICAFDIADDGTAVAVVDLSRAQKGYRWVHFDRADDALDAWVAQNVPELPGQALLQAETRPRCDRQDGGADPEPARGEPEQGRPCRSDGVGAVVGLCADHRDRAGAQSICFGCVAEKLRGRGKRPQAFPHFFCSCRKGLNARVQDVVF